MNLNLLMGKIMSLPCYENFTITMERYLGDTYSMKMKFAIGDYHSFTICLSRIDEHIPGDLYMFLSIQPATVAPDWEPDCDEDEIAYNAAESAERDIMTGLNDLCKKNGLTISYETHSRWTHRELCAFYPDRPEIMDMDMRSFYSYSR